MKFACERSCLKAKHQISDFLIPPIFDPFFGNYIFFVKVKKHDIMVMILVILLLFIYIIACFLPLMLLHCSVEIWIIYTYLILFIDNFEYLFIFHTFGQIRTYFFIMTFFFEKIFILFWEKNCYDWLL